jgi:tetratricopeptide (TPR) repeat protein
MLHPQPRSLASLRALRWNFLILLAASLLLSACGPAVVEVNPDDIKGDGDKVAAPPPKPKDIPSEAALKKFEDAIAAYQQNPTQVAPIQKLLQDAVQADPDFGEAWYNLGLLQEQQGQTDDAIKSYENAVKSRPDFSNPHINLAMLLYNQKQESARAKELLSKVVEDAGVDPYNVPANLNIAMILRIEGEVIVRKANAQGLAAEIKEGKSERQKLDIPEEAQSKFAQAVAHIRKALAGDSNNIISYENLAAIYYDLDKLEVATLVCEQAKLRQKERNADLDAQLAEGKINQAEHDALYIPDSEIAPVYNTLGLVQLAQGKVQEAYFNFKKADEMRENFIEAKLNVAGVAINVQDFPKALDLYQQVVQLQPNNLEAKLSLAVATRGTKDYETSEKIYLEIITKNPTSPPAYFNLAILYQEYLKDFDKAKATFEKFLNAPNAAEVAPAEFETAKLRIQELDETIKARAQAAAEEAERRARCGGPCPEDQPSPDGTSPDGATPPDGTTPTPDGAAAPQ